MISLKEHNTNKMNNFVNFGDPVKNDIACPECGRELWDTNPMMQLSSCPPQYAIHYDCGYKGFRK